MGKITEVQQNILSSFHCERLSSSETNKFLIRNFMSNKGHTLVDYLNSNEDINSANAFYLVKDADNEIVLFFSLKCGTVFSPFDEEDYKNKVSSFKDIMAVFNMLKKNNTEENKEIARHVLEQYRTSDDVDITQTILQIISEGKFAKRELIRLEYDKAHEVNASIHRVNKTYPAIEIVHFCVNDNLRKKWKSYNMNHPMGEVLFWEFIAPKIYEMQKIIGCQYVFLFAADVSENANLINYYSVALKFQLRKEVTTNKPSYDFYCTFMCQEIKDLIAHRKNYFEHFNHDDDLA